MTRHPLRWSCMAGLVVAAAAFSAGCGKMARQSVEAGVFAYISGGLGSIIDITALSGIFNDLVTGGLFAGTSTTTSNLVNSGLSGT